ncbi:Hypothetical predicted protein [Paramuricea clavata]|uniref:Uncharacterized protein n=1 Tax=Paramuricea clavata TaxID=317549 RepID=A0A6S7GHN1_PARCT|nr:Hypothetical predicted protein [Paramuricea clavata]
MATQQGNVLPVKKINYIYVNVHDALFDKFYRVKCLCGYQFEFQIAVTSLTTPYEKDLTLFEKTVKGDASFLLTRGVERKLTIYFDSSTHGSFVFSVLYRGFVFNAHVYYDSYLTHVDLHRISGSDTYTDALGEHVDAVVDAFWLYCYHEVNVREIFDPEETIRRKLFSKHRIYLSDIRIWRGFFFTTRRNAGAIGSDANQHLDDKRVVILEHDAPDFTETFVDLCNNNTLAMYVAYAGTILCLSRGLLLAIMTTYVAPIINTDKWYAHYKFGSDEELEQFIHLLDDFVGEYVYPKARHILFPNNEKTDLVDVMYQVMDPVWLSKGLGQ